MSECRGNKHQYMTYRTYVNKVKSEKKHSGKIMSVDLFLVDEQGFDFLFSTYIDTQYGSPKDHVISAVESYAKNTSVSLLFVWHKSGYNQFGEPVYSIFSKEISYE